MVAQNPFPDEPDLTKGEPALQHAVRALVEATLDSLPGKSLVIEGFGLDLAIWRGVASTQLAKFLELKVFKGARAGGVGFGNQAGRGPQVALLLASRDSLQLMQQTVRWIVADATRLPSQPRYALVSSLEAKDAVMGQVAHGKQNNFRIRYFHDKYMNWPQLCTAVFDFLAEAGGADA